MTVQDPIEHVFTYHPPKPDQPARYSVIRDKAKELAHVVSSLTPKSEEQRIALEKIREAVMWANAAIAVNE